jgi:two-component system, OmpR family, phosphate regulon sensor histidine kinase PhoR
MQKKNTLVIGLMCSSMLLLLLLQFFWIKSAYKNAADDFRKETNAMFRNTIFTMHDSLIQRSMTRVDGDTAFSRYIRKRSPGKTNETITLRGPLRDSLNTLFKVTEKTARIEIYSDSKSDSLGRILRPLVTRMQMGKEPKSFIIRVEADSLDRDSIQFYFKRELDKAGIDSKFKIVKVRGPRQSNEQVTSPVTGQFVSEIVPFTPMTQYAVSFTGTHGLLWKEIAPQVLFAIFLTLLTGASFIAMYKNLRSQQRLMEIKNDFISNVTHELKTPVATVSVALEALKNFNALHDPQKTKEYLDIAQRELNRLMLMTDKILKTSVYEDQGVNIKYESVQLDALVDQILSSMKLVFEKKQTQVTFQKTGSDFSMQGSVEHLTNVMYNLIDNALKYGGEESRLQIELESLASELVLKVRDSGIGIPQEYQKKIFEKFFRVPSGDVHNIKGYGLGLSYVASVIESHNGEITVESTPGEGSSFTVKLPKGVQS